jgi:KEOPS complex subunit Cgi121
MRNAPCGIGQARFTVADRDGFLDRLKDVATQTGTCIICFNADAMAGLAHVQAALSLAGRSFEGGAPIARTLEMEALLYASGSRQCTGTDAFGIHPGSNRAYVCICPESAVAQELLGSFMVWNDEDWESFSHEKRSTLMQLFSITPEELATVGDARLQELVLERVALLDVYR